jgi:hypothetical protein
VRVSARKNITFETLGFAFGPSKRFKFLIVSLLYLSDTHPQNVSLRPAECSSIKAPFNASIRELRNNSDLFSCSAINMQGSSQAGPRGNQHLQLKRSDKDDNGTV